MPVHGHLAASIRVLDDSVRMTTTQPQQFFGIRAVRIYAESKGGEGLIDL